MAAQDSHFTTIAGEYFVAHKLAMLGFVPAIVRQGVRSMDMLVSNQDGTRTIPVQVETAASAARDAARGETEGTLQFPLSQRSLDQAPPSTMFCFVDLRVRMPQAGPDVYVLDLPELRRGSSPMPLRKYSYLRYVRPLSALVPFRNNWQPFFDVLSLPGLESETVTEPEIPAIALRSRSPEWEMPLLRNQSA